MKTDESVLPLMAWRRAIGRIALTAQACCDAFDRNDSQAVADYVKLLHEATLEAAECAENCQPKGL